MQIILSMDGQSSSSLVVKNCMSNVLCKMVNFCLIRPMTLSTCILTLAIDLASSTSNLLFPFVNAGTCSFACIVPGPTNSAISKPLSARMMSLGSSFFF